MTVYRSRHQVAFERRQRFSSVVGHAAMIFLCAVLTALFVAEIPRAMDQEIAISEARR